MLTMKEGNLMKLTFVSNVHQKINVHNILVFVESNFQQYTVTVTFDNSSHNSSDNKKSGFSFT